MAIDIQANMKGLRNRLAKEHPAAVLEYLDLLLERDQWLRDNHWGALLDHAAKRARANRLARVRRARKRGAKR